MKIGNHQTRSPSKSARLTTGKDGHRGLAVALTSGTVGGHPMLRLQCTTTKRLRRAGRLVALCGYVFAAASPNAALAQPAPIRISGTGGQGVLVRPAPNTAQPAVGWIPEGASPDYNCYAWGERIGGVPIWFNVNYNGVTGFYSSRYDNSSYNSDAELQSKYGVPICGGSAPTPPNPTPPSPAEQQGAGTGADPTTPKPATATPGFDRNMTRAWARVHSMDPPGRGTACTWFVSQALWAGGLAETATWTRAGSHGRVFKVPGSETAWVTPTFIRYILRTYPKSTFTQLRFGPSGNSVPEAEYGDVIVYDWEGTSSSRNVDDVDHAAIITGFKGNRYPLVSEWSAHGKAASTYESRGWTWSKVSSTWLQSKFPKVKAYLLHIRTD